MPHTFTKLSFFTLFLLSGYFAQAQVNYVWTGAVSTDWNNAGNWSPAGVPGSTDYAQIITDHDTHVSNFPLLKNDITVRGLGLSQAQMDVNGFKIKTESFGLFRSIINSSNSNNIQIDCRSCGIGQGSVVNGNSVFTVGESFGDGSDRFSLKGNSYKGNVKITVNGTGYFQLSEYNGFPTEIDGNLEIERKAPGTFNDIFMYGGVVNGNFSYSNLFGGIIHYFGWGGVTTIKGRTDIVLHGSTENNSCYMFGFVCENGGKIQLHNLVYPSIKYCDLNIETIDIKVREDVYATFEYNTVTSDLDINYDFSNGSVMAFTNNKFNKKINLTTTGANGEGGISFWSEDNQNNQFLDNVSISHHGNSSVEISAYWQPVIFFKNLTLNGNLAFEKDEYENFRPKTFTFKGTDNSIFECNTTAPITFHDISVEKTGPGKLTISKPINILGKLSLNGGIVETSTGNDILLLDNAIVSGGSDASHITGPVRKMGNDAFTFPIGSGNKFTPVSITAPSSETDEFGAQYYASGASSSGYSSNSKSSSLNNVFSEGYWDIKRLAGTSNVSVSLGYNVPTGYITDQSKLRVAHWNGSMWEDLGNGGTSGSLTVGTVSTAGGVTSFSPFTIASADASNPLPVKLAKFSVRKENTTALLQWTTTEEINSGRFEIEHSLNAKDWQKISEVKAAGESKAPAHYDYVHTNPLKGLNYYRLKMIDADETFAYSKIEKMQLNGGTQTSMYPNPVSDKLFVETANGVSAVKAELMSIIGTKMLSANAADLRSGIDLSKLSAGIYFVNITLSNGQKETHKVFVKK